MLVYWSTSDAGFNTFLNALIEHHKKLSRFGLKKSKNKHLLCPLGGIMLLIASQTTAHDVFFWHAVNRTKRRPFLVYNRKLTKQWQHVQNRLVRCSDLCQFSQGSTQPDWFWTEMKGERVGASAYEWDPIRYQNALISLLLRRSRTVSLSFILDDWSFITQQQLTVNGQKDVCPHIVASLNSKDTLIQGFISL